MEFVRSTTDVIEATEQIVGWCHTETGMKYDAHCMVCGYGAFGSRQLEPEIVAVHYIVIHLHIESTDPKFIDEWRRIRRTYNSDEMRLMR